jgi:septum formation protein
MLVLASRSLIRKALLDGAGIAVEVRGAGVNERKIEADAAREKATPSQISRLLAEAKAAAIDADAVIGADQMLELDGVALHKVEDMETARKRLDQLKGRTHLLHTAIAIAKKGAVVWSTVETNRMTMRAFGNVERDAYLNAEGESVLGSVGVYLYEGRGIRLFERVEGDFSSILGLPLLPLIAALRRHVPDALKGFT